jgi:hypothetical protein
MRWIAKGLIIVKLNVPRTLEIAFLHRNFRTAIYEASGNFYVL